MTDRRSPCLKWGFSSEEPGDFDPGMVKKNGGYLKVGPKDEQHILIR